MVPPQKALDHPVGFVRKRFLGGKPLPVHPGGNEKQKFPPGCGRLLFPGGQSLLQRLTQLVIRPVRSASALFGTAAQLLCTHKRRQCRRDLPQPVLQRIQPFFPALLLLPCFQRLPQIRSAFAAENVGVPVDHFATDAAAYIVKIKAAGFRFHLGMQHDLQQNIPQLLLQ